MSFQVTTAFVQQYTTNVGLLLQQRGSKLRDACTVGREHRYDDLQIGYHYTKERAFLQRALTQLP